MKSFNHTEWEQVSAGTEFKNNGAKVKVMLASPGALFLKTGSKKKALIGYGTEFNVAIEGTDSPVLSASSDGAYFMFTPRRYVSQGVPHTNADKRDEAESAVEALVRSAERRIALRERESARKMRSDFNMMLRKRKEMGLQDEAPQPVVGDDDYTPPDPPAPPAPGEEGHIDGANTENV